MSEARFDPANAVTFDLPSGLVRIGGTRARVLVPAEALAALLGAAGEVASRACGRVFGEAIGERIGARLPDVRSARAETVVEHLGGEIALAGLGALSMERWGSALVLVLDDAPLDGSADVFFEELLEHALQAITRLGARAAALGRERQRARFLVTSEAGVEHIKAWLAEGISWGEAIVRLHAQAGGGA